MKSRLSSGVLSGMMLLIFAGSALAQGQLITGVRTWKFTDGSERRAMFRELKNDVVILYSQPERHEMPISRFIPEHQEILKGLQTGAIVKLKYPAPGVNTRSGTERFEPGLQEVLDRHSVLGKERQWRKADGKTAIGSLSNLTDDEILLLIRGATWKINIADLSASDVEYLERVKRGEEEVIPNRVDFSVAGYRPPAPDQVTDAWVPGIRFTNRSVRRLTFEEAATTAKAKMSSKIDERFWKLMDIEEFGMGVNKGGTFRIPGLDYTWSRKGYVVLFEIEKAKIPQAKKLFPGQVDEIGRYYLSFFDDGEEPEYRFVPRNPK